MKLRSEENNPGENVRQISGLTSQRECLPLHDLADCLVDVYDDVAGLAYQKYLMRGPEKGSELDDWIAAEKELLQPMAVDFEDNGEYVRALASVPGYAGREISLGIEPGWLLIRAHRAEHAAEGVSSAPEAYGDALSVALGAEAGESEAPSDLGCNASEEAEQASGRSGSRSAGGRARANRRSDAEAQSAPAAVSEPGSMFLLRELSAHVDPARSIAVLANGVLGIRMPKIQA